MTGLSLIDTSREEWFQNEYQNHVKPKIVKATESEKEIMLSSLSNLPKRRGKDDNQKKKLPDEKKRKKRDKDHENEKNGKKRKTDCDLDGVIFYQFPLFFKKISFLSLFHV